MLAVIADPSFSRERVILISAIWNAGLDVREHLPVFIDIALEGTAEECFECITVIENQEIWPEKACRSALVQLKKALPEVTDNYRSAMLSDLMKVLEYRLGVGEN
jgi:hypothetical protein